MRKRHNYWLTALPVVAGSVLASCGSKKKDSTDDPAAPAAEPEPTIASGTTPTTADPEALLKAFPSQLVLSFFSDQSSSALRLDEPTEADEDAAFEDAKRPPDQRAKESKERLTGNAKNCAPEILKRPSPLGRGETCYEFDQDQIYGTRDGSNYTGNRYGVNADGEACMVGFAKSKVAVVNDLLERAKAMVETMLCQAKKIDPALALPAASGESLDLKAALETGMSAKAKSISTAKLERIDIDGEPVYKSTIVTTHGGEKQTIVLVHSPGDGEAYQGSLYTIRHADADSAELQGGGQSSSKDKVLSINYARIEDADAPETYRMQGRLVRGHLAPELTDIALGDDGLLDLSAFRNFEGDPEGNDYGKAMVDGEIIQDANSVVSGQTLITFDLTDEGVGTTAYFENPGGGYNEPARGMVANVKKDDKGRLYGCSISGAALGEDSNPKAYSIAKAQKFGLTLNPTGFVHPFFSLGVWQDYCTETGKQVGELGNYQAMNCNFGSQPVEWKWYYPLIEDETLAEEFVSEIIGGIVTRQCYAFNQDSGVWEIDTNEITETAGYELVRFSGSDKVIDPPKLDKRVRPLKNGVGKSAE